MGGLGYWEGSERGRSMGLWSSKVSMEPASVRRIPLVVVWYGFTSL